jgi:Arc/MetJ-type ribon-helix-helix transcriptional regulator
MRTTETMTISLPPAMAKQMELVQKEEHRTRSELLREAWRQYFEGRYAVYKPTKAELTSIRRGRADYKRGDVIKLSQLHDELESARQQKRPRRTRKTS